VKKFVGWLQLGRLNCFTRRTSWQGSGEVGPAFLAAELFHLPDEPAGVLALVKILSKLLSFRARLF